MQYPGSPVIAAQLLNPGDKLHAFELHTSDFPLLQQALRNDKRAKVHHLNAYDALAAFLPPPSKRGLVMIDPSYEVKSEYQQVIELVQLAHKRFSTGIYAVWYPIVDRDQVNRFVNGFKQAKIPNILRSELCIAPDSPEYGMTGSGMLIINPPYTLQNDLKNSDRELHDILGLYSEMNTMLN